MNFENIKGFYQVKRALGVAAVGGHPILLIGGMGSGKTMAAEAVKTITDVPVTIYEGVTDLTKPQRNKIWEHIKANKEMIICTTLPCPCGNLLRRGRRCMCTASVAHKYWTRFVGSAEYIPLHIHIPELNKEEAEESTYKFDTSEDVKRRVLLAQALIDVAYGGLAQHLSTEELASVKMDELAQTILKNVQDKLGLSVRQREDVVRVAVSIAALEGKVTLTASDIAEAVQYQGKYYV